jgi:hypothetical protein
MNHKYKFRFLDINPNDIHDDYTSYRNFTVGKIYDVYMDDRNAIIIDDTGGKNIINTFKYFEILHSGYHENIINKRKYILIGI